MTSPVLSVKNLSKTFAGQQALRDVALELQAGEIRALVGQNGSGKSTLIKILAGFHAPDPGAHVSVSGRALSLGQSRASELAGLRFVHQDLGLVVTMDTADNLALGNGYQTAGRVLINWRSQRRLARSALEDLGYQIDVRRPMSELTVAERTAVAVVRALSHHATEPRVLVLDEPTANLPVAEADRLFALVRGVRDKGLAILFVSHHLSEVFELCDTVTVLRDGRHISTQGTEGLTENELVNLMIGRELSESDQRIDVASPQGEVKLAVEGLTSEILNGVDIAVRAGEVVGVAGITGSGREQLASCVFGGHSRQGVVRIENHTLPALRPDLSVAASMGLVPAERHANAAFLDANLRENVSVVEPGVFARFGLINTRLEKSDVARWLSKLGVHAFGSEQVMATLSGGNQQKIVLARWLRRNPRVLVLDEPTQGVDVGAKAEIHALVDQAASAGTAVLVTSTDNDELARLCDRVLVLVNGRIVQELSHPYLDADSLTAATLTVPSTTTGAVRHNRDGIPAVDSIPLTRDT